MAELLPGNPSDEEVRRNTHPPGWQNPVPRERYDLVVLGGGTAGLVGAGVEAAMERMRGVRATISRHDAAAAFRDEYAVDVLFADARFAGPDSIDVGGRRVRFRRALIATGSRPTIPSVPGLAEAGFETNE